MAGDFWDAFNKAIDTLEANLTGSFAVSSEFDEEWWVLTVHPEDPKLQPGTCYETYKWAVAQEGEMNRKKFMGQYDNPADEYALKAKSPVDSGPTGPISQWLRPK